MQNFERELRKYRRWVRGILHRPQPPKELTQPKRRGLLARILWAVTGKIKGGEE